MSGGGGPNSVNLMLGFIVMMLILVELHGFSAASAIFAIPALIFTGIMVFIAHLLTLLTGFFIGSLFAGPIGLLVLGLALVLVSKSLTGFTAQNYMLFAIFLVMALLLV